MKKTFFKTSFALFVALFVSASMLTSCGGEEASEETPAEEMPAEEVPAEEVPAEEEAVTEAAPAASPAPAPQSKADAASSAKPAVESNDEMTSDAAPARPCDRKSDSQKRRFGQLINKHNAQKPGNCPVFLCPYSNSSSYSLHG